jgi:hypothetical protein
MAIESKTSARIGRRGALAGATAFLAAPAIVRAQGAQGVALVIGNSKYHWEASLPNVKRDAPDIARRFQAMGIKADLLEDATGNQMRQALERFRTASTGANLAVLYFAGHGASWGKDTYLVPVDADLASPSVVETLIKTQGIGQSSREAKGRLQIFDNCRNNPADGWRQLEAERSAAVNPEAQRASGMSPLPNTLALYSTAPGRVALDGPAGQNSPFAAALLRQLAAPTIDLQTLAPALRRDLLIATQARQVLWDRNSYQQPFTLRGSTGGASGGAAGGWAGDPSKIVELTNAYNFANQNGLPIPLGLVAHRPPSNSRDARKVGSFQYTARGGNSTDPQLLIVMSVEEQRTAECIMCGKSPNGAFWRFITASMSGDRIEFVPRAGAAKFMLDWSGDGNSGSMSQFFEGGGGRNPPYTTKFTRLDG